MAWRTRLGPIARRASTAGSLRRSATVRNTTTAGTSLRCLSSTPTRCFRDSAPRRGGGFTTDSYPEIKRDPRFAQITAEHVAHFRALLGGRDSAVVDGVTAEVAADDMEPYNGDWMRKYRGHCKLVLKPAAGTRAGGGSVPVFDEIVVSTSRMNQIRSFDEVSGVLVADAGVVLEVADQSAATCPRTPAVSVFCGTGGLHGNVLGLQAVLPDGTVVDDLCTLRKNNTGYDLKQLFIGGEGTIGMITAVSIQCPQRPKAVNVAFLGADSFEKIQLAFREAKAQLSEILSAFELMDSYSQDMVHRVRQNKRPLEGEHPFYCLIETSGSNTEHDAEKLERFLEDVMSKDIIADGVLAQDETQIKSLWSQREGITECVGHFGGTYKYDVSIPLKDLYRLVDETRERIEAAGLKGDTDEFPVVEVVGYGHMGDCNLHLNVAARRYDKRVEEVLEPFVYEWIGKINGSISAEHGIGIAKKKYLGFSRNDTMIGLMKQVKKLYDPNGIMNPYKYI
ncbi:hypothetical protein CIB48_g5053 [Xylaria polymorpha]|nr:hypothetical protein CIB48_g5053 [Xylaria polymorpha]